MPNKEDGLYEKYTVTRNDGKPMGPSIVLEFKDPNARIGIAAWSKTVRAAGYEQLANDTDLLLSETYVNIKEKTIYYFGCLGEKGHYLFDKNQQKVDRKTSELFPFVWQNLDSNFAPLHTRSEGQAKLHHEKGWTILAFWDYSVDTRPGSNSAIAVDGIWTFDEVLTRACYVFPKVFSRFQFKIVEYNE